MRKENANTSLQLKGAMSCFRLWSKKLKGAQCSKLAKFRLPDMISMRKLRFSSLLKESPGATMIHCMLFKEVQLVFAAVEFQN